MCWLRSILVNLLWSRVHHLKVGALFLNLVSSALQSHLFEWRRSFRYHIYHGCLSGKGGAAWDESVVIEDWAQYAYMLRSIECWVPTSTEILHWKWFRLTKIRKNWHQIDVFNRFRRKANLEAAAIMQTYQSPMIWLDASIQFEWKFDLFVESTFFFSDLYFFV